MNAFERLLIGNSPELKAQLRTAQIAALTDVPLMITGASGSGKSLLAEAVHLHSPRSRGPLVTLSCALTEPEALEHGWHEARGGTLLLEELSELSGENQARLLALLEQNPERHQRDHRGQVQNVRVITTAGGDPHPLVDNGRLRRDLYFRLKVVPLELPDLKARTGDVQVLFDHFSLEIARRYDVGRPHLTRDAETTLARHRWPGNVRELKNLCERLVILFAGKAIDVTNLPQEIQTPAPQVTRFRLPDSGLSLDDLERDMIRQALERTVGNRSRAARLLGITRDTLLYRLKKYAMR